MKKYPHLNATENKFILKIIKIKSIGTNVQ